MKLIIAGSRHLNDYSYIDKAIAFAGIEPLAIKEVVSGMNSDIDHLAVQWANNHKIKVKEMPANWKNIKTKDAVIRENQYGKYNAAAGYSRNKKMAEYGTHLLAILDEDSKDVESLIANMEELGKEFWVYEL